MVYVCSLIIFNWLLPYLIRYLQNFKPHQRIERCENNNGFHISLLGIKVYIIILTDN